MDQFGENWIHRSFGMTFIRSCSTACGVSLRSGRGGGDAKDVRVDDDAFGFAVGHAEDDVSSLAAAPGTVSNSSMVAEPCRRIVR